MKIKYCLLYTFVFPIIHNFTLLNETGKAHANESVYVYCADKQGNWDWLKDTKGNYVLTNGSWESSGRSCLSPFDPGIHNWEKYSYFLIDGGERQILSLKNQCINQFTSYDTPYAYYSGATANWYPFAVNKNKILNGKITLIIYNIGILIPVTENEKFIRHYPEKEYLTQHDISSTFDCLKGRTNYNSSSSNFYYTPNHFLY